MTGEMARRTLQECEAVIEGKVAAFIEVGQALQETVAEWLAS